ncbi:Oxygen-independent coproporphyrinogen-III oxidase [Phycisphaerae bacterium RAS1]|nr:Oxygen-independent coproporphyrinogen-III oxidase [Phycisphaerae bacterium RAS1]
MQLDVLRNDAQTEVGSYFVANYPPFSAWGREHLPTAQAALSGAFRVASSELNSDHDDYSLLATRYSALGLYLHIPFCRKRCKFCYFRVYTDKNADEVELYMDALAREIALYKNQPALAGRQFEFVYFGGGTPSFLSSAQLSRLVERINQHWTWEAAREVTFECEPGTLKKSKLETIRSIGVTRLSLGVEHFDDGILELNGRAHRSKEIGVAYEWAREVGFPQINIDLIAGMLGDDESKWKAAVERAVAMQPDSVTIYQMELPHNTVISREAKDSGVAPAIVGWAAKRAWTAYAFEQFERAGYVVSSGYTLVRAQAAGRKPERNSETTGWKPIPHQPADSEGRAAGGGFVYRDALWHGGDMIGTGVASFSHVAGVHFQNLDKWDEYVAAIQRGELPLARALPMTPRQRLIRELALQTKLGRLDAAYFRSKFGVEIAAEFGEAIDSLVADGFATACGDEIRLTRDGLLRVDALLPRFFEPQFRSVRYT